jgi:hypothetical protein
MYFEYTPTTMAVRLHPITAPRCSPHRATCVTTTTAGD